MRSKLWRAGALAAGLTLPLVLASSARAIDITFGGNARWFAMGGAGLALVDKTEHTTLVNPAAIALYNRRVIVPWPNISFRASGVPLDKAYDHLLVHPSENDAVGLARDFGSKDSNFGASLGWGVRLGHLEVQAEGVAQVHVIPNAALQTWSKTANGNTALLTGNERADMLGAAIYSLPQIGWAERVSPAGSPIRMEAGVRVKLMRAIYSHYIVNSQNIATNTAATPAPELNGGTSLTKDGIGADLGFLIHPRSRQGFSGALVVTNLIEPNFRFNGTGAGGTPVKYDLQPRSVSIGSAYYSGRLTAVADAVDLSRAYGNVQGRIGAEYETRRIAFRAGYTSARGFTFGFGWGFVQLAFGERAPLTVSEFLRF